MDGAALKPRNGEVRQNSQVHFLNLSSTKNTREDSFRQVITFLESGMQYAQQQYTISKNEQFIREQQPAFDAELSSRIRPWDILYFARKIWNPNNWIITKYEVA